MRLYLYVLLVALVFLAGCMHTPHAPAVPAAHSTLHNLLPSPGTTPKSEKVVAVGLDAIAIIGVIVLAVGVGLYFFVPAAHNLFLAFAGMGGAAAAIAMVFRASLWFMPWVSLGLFVLAVGFLIYEWIRNHALLDADVTGLLTSAKTETTTATAVITSAVSKVETAAAGAAETATAAIKAA